MLNDEKIIEAVVNRHLYELDRLEEIIPAGEDAPYLTIDPEYHDIIDFQVRDHF